MASKKSSKAAKKVSAPASAHSLMVVGGIVAVVVIAGILLTTPGILPSSVSVEDAGVAEEQAAAEPAQEEAAEEAVEPAAEEAPAFVGEEHVIQMNSVGFVPSGITVKAGDKVTFVQTDGSNRWPASAVHPTHTVYPGSSIAKCGTGEATFDACHGLAEGESWSFVFDEVGTWKYHDHLHTGFGGTIAVE